MSGLKEVAEAEEWMRKKSGFYVWLKRGGSGRRVDFMSGLKEVDEGKEWILDLASVWKQIIQVGVKRSSVLPQRGDQMKEFMGKKEVLN